jgi:small GTP-binding protein
MCDRPDRSFKLIVVGESAVGKTSIVFRYCKDTFTEDRAPTVGVGFQPKCLALNDERIKLAIWDTAGQEQFATLTDGYYRNADGVLLVYDIANRRSLDALASRWLPQIAAHADPGVEKLVVGNKADLRPAEGADPDAFVTTARGEAFARQQRAMFVETSAKTAENVASAFEELARRIQERARTAQRAPPKPPAPVDIEAAKPAGASTCC